jgi:DnaJ homolog subfamily A member 5
MDVDRDADDAELRRAYKKQALLCHPDKNRDDPESAAIRFKELQEAYKVLSNADERHWYDEHREQILRGGDVGGDGAQVNVSNLNLWPYFSEQCCDSVDSDLHSDTNFYRVYGKIFKEIDEEEASFVFGGARHRRAPRFGGAADEWKPGAKAFYDHWGPTWTTCKSFSWHDKHNTMEAPNRRVKRLMEKENAKAREKHKREFVELVRSLVAFVRKRDPRYRRALALRKQQAEAKLVRDEQQRIERSAARARRIEESLAECGELTEAEIAAHEQHLRDLEEEFGGILSDNDDDDENDDDGKDALYCPACKRSFRTEAQKQNHERGKKHQKLWAQYVREHGVSDDDDDDDIEELDDDSILDVTKMSVEELQELILDDDDDNAIALAESLVAGTIDDAALLADDLDNLTLEELEALAGTAADDDDDDDDDDGGGEEDALFVKRSKKNKKKMEQRRRRQQQRTQAIYAESSDDEKEAEEQQDDGKEDEGNDSVDDGVVQPIKGKRRRRRRNKRTAASSFDGDLATADEIDDSSIETFACRRCGKVYPSKTKLFKHLNDTGHALAV